jgi:hypothetical protein
MKALLALPLLTFSICGASLTTDNYVRYYAATDPLASYACFISNGPDCNGTTTVLETGWTLDYLARSSAQFGILRAASSASLTGFDNGVANPTFISAGGRASYTDTLTILGGTGNGTQTLNFHVTGTGSQSPGNSGRAQMQAVRAGVEYNYLANGNGDIVITIPFTFGVPFTYTIHFYALSQIYRYENGSFATADFYRTAVLNGIAVQDQAGIDVPSFSILAQSGTAYTSAGVVPEPSTWSFVPLSGLMFLAARRLLPKPWSGSSRNGCGSAGHPARRTLA